MTTKFLLPILLIWNLTLLAQVENPCSAISYSQDYLNDNPHEKAKVLEMESQLQERIATYESSAEIREVITIPVVVHLVLKDGQYNFTETEIRSQIDGLTADFRKRNDNQNIIPDEFKERAADVEIEFCLATLTPDSQPTKGFQKKFTQIENIGTARNFGLERVICHNSLGGFDAWDPKRYLNIWVGEMESALGEATFPGMARVPEEDGVWIDVDAFGFFCSIDTKFHLGRTLTHEVGHYLNLKHIFGDTNDCLSDDGIDDTPVQEKPNTKCEDYPKLNVCDSLEPHEMTVNFMDYVPDECMAMFTEGQKIRMLSSLDLFRPELKESNRCLSIGNPRTTLDKDLITVFPNPASNCIHIDLGVDDTDFEIRVELMDSAGKRIFSKIMDVKDIRSLDISTYPNGIYFLLFENGSNFASQKIIINK